MNTRKKAYSFAGVERENKKRSVRPSSEIRKGESGKDRKSGGSQDGQTSITSSGDEIDMLGFPE